MLSRFGVALSVVSIALGMTQVAFASSVSDEFLKNLSGCFSVSFRYVEDGKNDQTIEGLYEWAVSVKGDPGKIQHYGIVDNKAFKHWREEWTETANGWWNQKVIGPFEDFRYQCAAPIVFNQWTCKVLGAPKPRRDKDRDYLNLDRHNMIQSTPKGVVQSENNVKNGKDGKPIANELGWNEYRRVDNSFCAAATNFSEDE